MEHTQKLYIASWNGMVVGNSISAFFSKEAINTMADRVEVVGGYVQDIKVEVYKYCDKHGLEKIHNEYGDYRIKKLSADSYVIQVRVTSGWIDHNQLRSSDSE